MRLDLQIQAQISSWSEESRVTKKGWLTRSCVINVCMQSLCGDFDFPAFSGDGTYLWSSPCIPWQAGAVAPFCSGWWLSNFSPRLHQAPSSWVTTVGQGEKALMWKQPLLYLISPLNHIKEMWRRGSKLRTIIKELILTDTSGRNGTWFLQNQHDWKESDLIPQQSQQSLKSVLLVKYVEVKEITNHHSLQVYTTLHLPHMNTSKPQSSFTRQYHQKTELAFDALSIKQCRRNFLRRMWVKFKAHCRSIKGLSIGASELK